MRRLRASAVEVYVYRRVGHRVEFLVLQRGPRSALPGVWQPVTGKVRRGEAASAAARRELREETGLTPVRWHCLETATFYFEPARDRFACLPLFAAEVSGSARVRLSAEHRRWRWTSAGRARRLFLWRAQRAGLVAVQREVLGGGTLARALEIPSRRGR